jgi:hypothetical protein
VNLCEFGEFGGLEDVVRAARSGFSGVCGRFEVGFEFLVVELWVFGHGLRFSDHFWEFFGPKRFKKYPKGQKTVP